MNHEKNSLSYHIANVISYLINPLCLPPIGVYLILWHFNSVNSEKWTVFIISALFFGILPFLFILWMLQKGHTETIEIRDREDRPRALRAALVLSLIGGILMIWQGKSVRPILLAMVFSQITATIFAHFITHYWKISLHLTGVAGFLGGLYYAATHHWFIPTAAVIREDWLNPLLVLIPILMWARMKVKAHTFGQVLGGTLLGFLTTYILFYLITDITFPLHY